MNRKNEVSALLSKARTAAQRGDYAGSFFNLGSALALSDQFDEAAEAYRKAVRIAPHVAAGHCGLADALIRLGKFEEAEVEYRPSPRAQAEPHSGSPQPRPPHVREG